MHSEMKPPASFLEVAPIQEPSELRSTAAAPPLEDEAIRRPSALILIVFRAGRYQRINARQAGVKNWFQTKSNIHLF